MTIEKQAPEALEKCKAIKQFFIVVKIYFPTI